MSRPSQKLVERSRALRAELAAMGHTRLDVGGAIKRALDADPNVTAGAIASMLEAEAAEQRARDERFDGALLASYAKLATFGRASDSDIRALSIALKGTRP